MKKLTKEQILMIHNELIRETGGSVGLRDEGLLDSEMSITFRPCSKRGRVLAMA